LEQLQVEITDPQVAHLAVLHQPVKRLESLFQLYPYPWPMDQIQIQVVHTQAAQAVFAAAQHVHRLQMLGGDLGSDEEPWARHVHFTDDLAEQFFGVPGGIRLGCVEVGIAQFQGRAQRQPGVFVGRRIVAEPPGAKANFGNLQVGEGFVPHRSNYIFRNPLFYICEAWLHKYKKVDS